MREAERAADSRAAELLGQIGILARALVVFLVAAIAVEILRGATDRPADTRGALQTLAATPAGFVLLIMVAIAFASHAAWRLLEAATGLHRDRGAQRTLKRLGFAAIGALYAGLCLSALRVLAGRQEASEDQASHKAASDLLGLPGGRLLTALIGAVIVGAAVGVGIWALRGGFLNAVDVERLDRRQRRAVRWIGAAGQASRAGVIAVAGFLFIDAALEDNGSRAQGLDGTLRTLAERHYGTVLLSATCAGLILFGIYSIVEAILLRTSADDRKAERFLARGSRGACRR